MDITDINNSNLNICPVCGKYVFSEENSNEVCPECGWEHCSIAEQSSNEAMLPNHISMTQYKELYRKISEDISDYRWSDYPEEWSGYIDEYRCQPCRKAYESEISTSEYIIFADASNMFASLTRCSTGLIASRPNSGEKEFISSIYYFINRQNRKVDVWDLYGDSSFLNHPLFTDCVTLHSEKTDYTGLIKQIRNTDNPDIIILFGIQAIQKNPFDPKELRQILMTIKELAKELNAAIIIYSGLLRVCDTREPTLFDLSNIGLDVSDFDVAVSVIGHKVKMFKNAFL